MYRTRCLFTLVASFASLSFVSGCSSSDSTGSGSGSGTASGSSGTTSGSSVLFASDVYTPIFQASCSLGGAACHGDPSVATVSGLKRPYLGPSTGTASATTIGTVLEALAQPSSEDPSMPLVTPGDPTKSYLMYKMEGTQATLASSCQAGDDNGGVAGMGQCGLAMPETGTILAQNLLDTVRAWVTEGAPNN
jgi:hypothetical protein